MPADFTRPSALIILGAGPGQVPLIQKAQAMGYRVVAVDRDPLAPGFQYVDTAIRTSTHDTQKILAILKEKGYAWAGVLARTTAAEALASAAAIADVFRLPGLTPDLIAISTEKSTLRVFALRHGLSVPTGIQDTGNTVDPDDADYPVIVRPDSTVTGKSHIRFCPDRAVLFEAITQARNASANRTADIGHYIDGIDTTCLCWINVGQAYCLAWWDELVGITAHCEITGLGLSTPSIIEGTPSHTRAEALCQRLARCFPTVNALLLLSFRINGEGQPFLIEVHADLGGDLIAEIFLPAAVETFDFFALAIRIATAGQTRITPLVCRPTALYYCPVDKDLKGDDITRTLGAIIVRNDRIEENLTRLEDIIELRDLRFIKRPLHAEWRERSWHA
ncbi:MAG: hypothetical protein GXY80_09365 [Syntrophorhabdus aromaticivorans]|uniref:ATP-grasp domain-containing protein n=1 Tax=Syntrophorhabdus aromaticivorans TaxID=328301 RepID=A0A971S1W0_9BACT|nr:hypothetical protein [Syntrophorhabdus aromaticivorans]